MNRGGSWIQKVNHTPNGNMAVMGSNHTPVMDSNDQPLDSVRFSQVFFFNKVCSRLVGPGSRSRLLLMLQAMHMLGVCLVTGSLQRPHIKEALADPRLARNTFAAQDTVRIND